MREPSGFDFEWRDDVLVVRFLPGCGSGFEVVDEFPVEVEQLFREARPKKCCLRVQPS